LEPVSTAARLHVIPAYSTASYQNHDLQGIGLGYNNVTGWNFAGQNLTSAFLSTGTLTNTFSRTPT